MDRHGHDGPDLLNGDEIFHGGGGKAIKPTERGGQCPGHSHPDMGNTKASQKAPERLLTTRGYCRKKVGCTLLPHPL